MKSKLMRKLLALSMVGCMVFALSACGGNAESSDSTDETSSSGSETGNSESASADSTSTSASNTDSESGVHKIYTYEDRNALSGLKNPTMIDRSDIDKALPTEQHGDLTIGFSLGAMRSEFFVAMMDAAQEKCDEYGYELIVMDANDSVSQQSADVESMITLGVDVIVYNCIDVVAGAADVERAVEAGIPVIGCGADFAEDVPAVTSILASNFGGGWESGLYVGEFFEGQTINAGVIMGMYGHTIDESRMTGMISAILYVRAEQMGKPYSCEEDAYWDGLMMFEILRDNGSVTNEDFDFNILTQGEGNWNEEGGLAAMEDMIVAAPDMNLVMTGSDPMGIGAIKAIKDAGLTPGEDIYIACCADGGLAVNPYLESGEMLCTGYNSAYMNGNAMITLAHMIFEEGFDANNLPAATDLPTACITKANYEEYTDPDLDYCIELPLEVKTIPEIKAELGVTE